MYELLLIFQGLMFVAAGGPAGSPSESAFYAFFVDPSNVTLGDETFDISQHVPTITAVGSSTVGERGPSIVVGRDDIALTADFDVTSQDLNLVRGPSADQLRPRTFEEQRRDLSWVTSLGRLADLAGGSVKDKALDSTIFSDSYDGSKFSGRFRIDKGEVSTRLLWGEPHPFNRDPAEVKLYQYKDPDFEADVTDQGPSRAVARSLAVKLLVKGGPATLSLTPRDGGERRAITVTGNPGDRVQIIFSNDPMVMGEGDPHFLSFYNFTANPKGLSRPFVRPDVSHADSRGACSPVGI